MSNVLSSMQFGKIAPGMVRLSMNGKLAVKVGDSYKTYNAKTGNLVNCDQFVFDIGEDFFFVMPTNHVKTGDLILINNKPVYVLDVPGKNKIEVLDYLDGSVKTVLPERHQLLGNNYMYSKVVSMFGDKVLNKNTLMKYMMLNTMMGGKSGSGMTGIFGNTSSGGMNPLMMMMLMGGKNPMTEMFNFGDEGEELFGGMFDNDDEVEVDTDEEDPVEDDEDDLEEDKPVKKPAKKVRK